MIKAERTALPMWRRGDRPPFEGHNSELIFLYRSSVCFIKAKVLSRWQRTVVQMYIYKRGGRFSEGFLSSRQVNIKASPLRCNMWSTSCCYGNSQWTSNINSISTSQYFLWPLSSISQASVSTWSFQHRYHKQGRQTKYISYLKYVSICFGK